MHASPSLPRLPPIPLPPPPLPRLSFCKRVGRERRLGRRLTIEQGAAAVDAAEERGTFLSISEKRAFVRITLPLVFLCLYGKSTTMVQAATNCLRCLSCVAPRMVAQSMMGRVYSALDPTAVSETHTAPAMIKALSAVVRPMLRPAYTNSVLAPHLPAILDLTLAGIDANDSSTLDA